MTNEKLPWEPPPPLWEIGHHCEHPTNSGEVYRSGQTVEDCSCKSPMGNFVSMPIKQAQALWEGATMMMRLEGKIQLSSFFKDEWFKAIAHLREGIGK